MVYLQIQMNNIFQMHESDSVANLPHESNTIKFSQRKIICDDPLEEFTAIDPEEIQNSKKFNDAGAPLTFL